ncbi:MAG: GntR family transcriptional regulator [Gammaproteobacteria bacterium]|nr:GntR family transcriptional regulator [Gammaproteobacteria bacterium]
MTSKIVNLSKKKTGDDTLPQASRADQVQQQVLKSIRSGHYRPGDRIRETEVAKALGVSRTPVREALRRLESDGLLSFESWRGVVVSRLDRQQVSELYAMREVLEGAAARMAARHIDDAGIELLRLLLEKAQESPDDPARLAKLNHELHQTIYSAAHNRYLLQTLGQLENALALLRGTTYGVAGRADTAAAEHQAIVEAICGRDAEAAELAARKHIGAAQRARLRLMLEEEDQ